MRVTSFRTKEYARQGIFFLVSLLFFSCNNNHSASQTPGISVPAEHVAPTPDQLARRNRSEAYCKAHGVPIYTNPNSFFSDAEAQVETRTKDEVADRALALMYIGLKSEGLEQKYLDQIDHDFHISAKLSPAEKLYVTAANPTKQQTVDAGWRYEDLHIMLWALGFVDSLNYPASMCDVAADSKIIHGLTEQEFKQKAKLRSKKEILDQSDLILRLDWACVDARTKKQPAPGNLDKGVVYERHYALNWLIKYAGQSWDDVSTDT